MMAVDYWLISNRVYAARILIFALGLLAWRNLKAVDVVYHMEGPIYLGKRLVTLNDQLESGRTNPFD